MIKGKRGLGETVFELLNMFSFGLLAVICAFPFYYILINSISDNSLVMKGLVDFWPKGIHFNNYTKVFEMKGIVRATVNSVLRTGLGTLFMLVSCVVLGYAMSRQEYWHRKFWYRFLIITMYLGAGLIPAYLNFKRLGLLNTFFIYIVPSLVSPYNMILVKTYIEGIPQSLEEAAIMDGAGYVKRILWIILPLSKPIIATVAIFTAVSQWNSFMDTILYTTSSNLQTLQSLLHSFSSRADKLARIIMESGFGGRVDLSSLLNGISVRHTITAITILPVMMVYPFFQKYFAKGLMIGAVKG